MASHTRECNQRCKQQTHNQARCTRVEGCSSSGKREWHFAFAHSQQTTTPVVQFPVEIASSSSTDCADKQTSTRELLCDGELPTSAEQSSSRNRWGTKECGRYAICMQQQRTPLSKLMKEVCGNDDLSNELSNCLTGWIAMVCNRLVTCVAQVA